MATSVFIFGLLLVLVFNPMLLYAIKNNSGNYTILSQQQSGAEFIKQLNNANSLIMGSELFDSDMKYTICMNDGCIYPRLIEFIQGHAFAYGFYHIIALRGEMNAGNNYVELNGYRWNLTELLAHEATHCMQFNKFGLLQSYPIARIPMWKWEGYPEYVARKNKASLVKNISQLVATINTDNNNWICFDDSTGTVIPYFKSWLLVQYCIDIRKMSYAQLLQDTTHEELVNQNMMNWYYAKNK